MIYRSLAANPSHARGWLCSGWLLLWAGRTDLAIKHFETSARLDPRGDARKLPGIGQAHFFNRRFGDALENLLMAHHHGTNVIICRFLASCYAHMGRLDDAREIVGRLRSITTIMMPDASYRRNPKHRELFLSGLRLAAG